MMISRLLFALIVLAPAAAMAAAEGAGPHGGIPWKMIGAQTFNVLVLAALLHYLVRAAVVAHFKDRRQSYLDLVGRAEAARKEAEAKHQAVAQDLKELQQSAQENAQKAQTEADALKAKLIREAEEIAEKLKNDAKRTAEIEIEKAKLDIQSFALQQALEGAQKKLSSEASQVDQSRLQSEFIEKIQAVAQ